jgi:CheY-like chemotaxis protein
MRVKWQGGFLMRILIAEDDFTSCTVLAGVLKKGGHDVVETVNSAEAWEKLQKPDAPKLAILDWMMPVMDGLEVLRRIRNPHSRTTRFPSSP